MCGLDEGSQFFGIRFGGDGLWARKNMFTPKLEEDEPILTSIFFKGVGSTTN